jgi:hypothetical protein
LDRLERLLRLDLFELTLKNDRVRRKFEECLEAVKQDIVHFQHSFLRTPDKKRGMPTLKQETQMPLSVEDIFMSLPIYGGRGSLEGNILSLHLQKPKTALRL